MNKKSSYDYLFRNIGLLTLSQFATKLLAFFLVPLYTSVLTTTEYGTYDLFTATIGVLLPILTLNIQEAVVRFSLDKNTDDNAIVTISTKYLIFSNTLIVLVLLANAIFGVSEILYTYSIPFFFLFFAQSLSGVMTAYIRGIDKVADLSISSVVTSAVTISCNILFLVVFKWGILGYFWANIIGPLVQCVYLIIRSDFIKKIKISKFEKENKAMLAYSKPLIANSISWWVNNVSDRYVVTFFCGLAENGIYSVAGKIPGILNIFQAIFNQAWTLSAVKEFDPEDKNCFFSNTYSAYNCMIVIICSGIIVFDKFLAKILYANDFFVAWRYVPWLTIAIVFGALSGYLGGFFTAVKDTKKFATSTIIGAITNLVLNLIFTPLFGAMAAAVATAVSYAATWGIRYWQSKKYIRLKISIYRDVLSYILLVIQSVLLLSINVVALYFTQVIIFTIIVAIYIKDLRLVINKIRHKFSKA